MTKSGFLPAAILLCFCISLTACADDGAANSPPSSADSAPDLKAVWPIAKTTLNPKLLAAVVKAGVPKDIATLAFNKFDEFVGRVSNISYITVIDFTRHSGKARLWMINTKTAAVDALNVAHGAGSDPDGTGIPTKFSNVPDSKMSSLGAYLISEKYQSTSHGIAMRLDGLEVSNDMVRDRAIVMHSATYVSNARSIMGMSWGCPAISLDWIAKALQRLSGGSFMYAYGVNSGGNPQLDEMQIQAIMTNPSYRWVNESEEAPVEGVR
jgi:hypothetical protein